MDTYRVPDLQLDDLIVYLETEATELYSDGHLVLLFEVVVHHSLHQARLADASVSDDDQFEKMILGAECLVSNDFEWHGYEAFYLILFHLNY